MSKVNMMSAKDKKKGALVPRLRFPEFIGDREWDCAQMGDIYAFKKNNSFSRDMLNYNAGDVKNIHYGDIHKKFSSHFYAENENIPFVNCNINLGSISEDCLCTAGDIIFADASEDIKDIGKCIEIISNNKERILSGLHTIFTRQFSSTLVIGFGGYLFQSPRVRAQIQKEAQGTKILGISSGRLATISISFPFAKGEQQKIADCLSSLDERIAAETNKLDALKAHKKGLLKQLFPAEGETLPQLRFPEFQDAGEWNKTRLNNCVSIHAGLNVEQVNYPTDYKVTRIETISTQKIDNYKVGYIHPFQGMTAYKLNVGDILFSNINSIEHIGKSVFIDKDYGIYHGMNLLRLVATSQPRIARFLFYYINTSSVRESFRRRANKAVNQASINQTELGKTVIYIPIYKKEQQRIADCLSSLDELIAAQTQKINLLKDHKKGLMQQLFPVLNEAQV